jgi:hypothetical protein
MNTFYKILVGLAVIISIAILVKPTSAQFARAHFNLQEKSCLIMTRKEKDYLVYARYRKTVFKWDDKSETYVLLRTERYSAYLLGFHRIRSNSN